MKNSKIYLLVAFIGQMAMACNKSNDNQVSPAALTVVNAIPSAQSIIPVVGTSDAINYFGSALGIGYESAYLYAPPGGATPLYIVQGTDTADPKQRLFSGNLPLSAGGIYSFFLAGNISKPDTLFVQDNLIYYADSSSGVRFVNLSPDAGSISINLKGSPLQKEFSNLSYKNISLFKQYPGNSMIAGNYDFEVRNQANDSLTSFTWTYRLHQSNTLVISGWKDPSAGPPIQVFQVNNY